MSLGSGELRVTVRVEYGGMGGHVVSERTLDGTSGNPRFAPQEIEKMVTIASADVQSAIGAITGDIRKNGAVL